MVYQLHVTYRNLATDPCPNRTYTGPVRDEPRPWHTVITTNIELYVLKLSNLLMVNAHLSTAERRFNYETRNLCWKALVQLNKCSFTGLLDTIHFWLR